MKEREKMKQELEERQNRAATKVGVTTYTTMHKTYLALC